MRAGWGVAKKEELIVLPQIVWTYTSRLALPLFAVMLLVSGWAAAGPKAEFSTYKSSMEN